MKEDKMDRRLILKTGAVAGAGLVAAACAPQNDIVDAQTKPCMCKTDKASIMPPNASFYKDGKFDVEKGKDAIIALMKYHGYPMYPDVRKELWVYEEKAKKQAHFTSDLSVLKKENSKWIERLKTLRGKMQTTNQNTSQTYTLQALSGVVDYQQYNMLIPNADFTVHEDTPISIEGISKWTLISLNPFKIQSDRIKMFMRQDEED